MALCVDLQAQEALEANARGCQQAPDCFIARLKFGELLMRLRICDQAAEHTQIGGASSPSTMCSLIWRAVRRPRFAPCAGKASSAEDLPVCAPADPTARKSRQQDTLPVLAASK